MCKKICEAQLPFFKWNRIFLDEKEIYARQKIANLVDILIN